MDGDERFDQVRCTCQSKNLMNKHEIHVDPDIAARASVALQRMLDFNWLLKILSFCQPDLGFEVLYLLS